MPSKDLKSHSSENNLVDGVSRRGVVKFGAWSAPVIATTVAVPAATASDNIQYRLEWGPLPPAVDSGDQFNTSKTVSSNAEDVLTLFGWQSTDNWATQELIDDGKQADITIGDDAYFDLAGKPTAVIGTFQGGQILLGTANTDFPIRVKDDVNWAKEGEFRLHAVLYDDVSIVAADDPVFESTDIHVTGQNATGNIGVGDTKNRNVLTRVAHGIEWGQVSFGSNNHVIGISKDRKLYTWGNNDKGQLGLGLDPATHPYVAEPTQVGTGNYWNWCAAGSDHSIVVNQNGQFVAAGNNDKGQLGLGHFNNPAGGTFYNTFQTYSHGGWHVGEAGNKFTALISTDSRLYTFGDNTYGQLGLGSFGGAKESPQLVNLANVAQVHMDGNFVISVAGNRYMYSWGQNNYGQLGLDDTNNRHTPQQVGTDSWRNIGTGWYHVAAINTARQLYTWGNNNRGQLGTGTTNNHWVPTHITTPTGHDGHWNKVTAGGNHSAAISLLHGTEPNKGELFTWGANTYGQLGLGHNDDVHQPTKAGTGTKWSEAIHFGMTALGVSKSVLDYN
ncbi:MAG: hypothetical protein QM571_02150 [Micrococcaceae bacterium]